MKNKKTDFDIFSPPAGHEERFRLKLAARMQSPAPQRLFLRRLAAMAAAAAILLLALLLPWNQSGDFDGVPGGITRQTAALKQSFMEQLDRIEKYDSPESKKIIEDSFIQWEKLQSDLEKLQNEFRKNNNDAVLNAMLQNLKMQTELLQNLRNQLKKIEKQVRYEKGVHQS